jgi:predicted phosphoribosyltransferase
MMIKITLKDGSIREVEKGSNSAFPIDIYVPESSLEDAKNIIVAVPILSDEIPDQPVNFDELTEEELAELIGEEDDE